MLRDTETCTSRTCMQGAAAAGLTDSEPQTRRANTGCHRHTVYVYGHASCRVARLPTLHNVVCTAQISNTAMTQERSQKASPGPVRGQPEAAHLATGSMRRHVLTHTHLQLLSHNGRYRRRQMMLFDKTRGQILHGVSSTHFDHSSFTGSNFNF